MIAIFDLDGTLALNEHRQHFLKEKPKNWDMFEDACIDDKPNVPLIRLFNLYISMYRTVYIFSGRSERVYSETVAWLELNGISPFGRLEMRKIGDRRDDRVVKKEMFDKLISSFQSKFNYSKDIIIFDDRRKVVDMWRDMGLTCCQVAEGNF